MRCPPHGTVSIVGTVALDAYGKVFIQEHPKTDPWTRTLKLPEYAADILTRRRVDSYGELVFPSSVGTLRWPHNLRRNWREALACTAYAAITPRLLRKAVATRPRDEYGIEVAGEQLAARREALSPGSTTCGPSRSGPTRPGRSKPSVSAAVRRHTKAPSSRRPRIVGSGRRGLSRGCSGEDGDLARSQLVLLVDDVRPRRVGKSLFHRVPRNILGEFLGLECVVDA